MHLEQQQRSEPGQQTRMGAREEQIGRALANFLACRPIASPAVAKAGGAQAMSRALADLTPGEIDAALVAVQKGRPIRGTTDIVDEIRKAHRAAGSSAPAQGAPGAARAVEFRLKCPDGSIQAQLLRPEDLAQHRVDARTHTDEWLCFLWTQAEEWAASATPCSGCKRDDCMACRRLSAPLHATAAQRDRAVEALVWIRAEIHRRWHAKHPESQVPAPGAETLKAAAEIGALPGGRVAA